MARLPRLVIPGLPHHVILRGNNSQPIFVDAQDYRSFLQLMAQQLQSYEVQLHGYALLVNRLHLLLSPATDKALSGLMQALGRSYVRQFNQRHRRTGTLWEGRFRAGALQPSPYVLGVMTYLDWLPVMEGLSQHPEKYEWGSHRHFAGYAAQRMLTPHPMYWDLADTPFGREAAYRSVVEAGIGSTLREQIQRSAMGGWVLGTTSFLEELAASTERRLEPGKPGRPRKKSE